MKRLIIIVTLLTLTCVLSTVNSQSYTPYSSTITAVGAGGVSEYTYYGYQSSDDYYGSTGYRAGGPNHAPQNEDDGWDFDDDDPLPDKPDGPMPIGNELWILLALAAAYGVIKRITRQES